MTLFELIVWICSLEITFYFLAVLIYTVITVKICFKAANENRDDLLRKKVLHPDFAFRAHVGYNSDHLKAQVKCLRILQEWRNDIRKQMVLLGGRLERKHSLVRRHCGTITTILKEELHCTEAQMKIILENDTMDPFIVDSQFVGAQLSMVRIFIEDLEKCLARFPESLDWSERC